MVSKTPILHSKKTAQKERSNVCARRKTLLEAIESEMDQDYIDSLKLDPCKWDQFVRLGQGLLRAVQQA